MPSSVRVRFGLGGNAAACRLEGFHRPEPGVVWSSGGACAVRLDAPCADEAVLAMRVLPFLLPGARESARLRIAVNGVALADTVIIQETVLALRVPGLPPGVPLEGALTIALETPDGARPADFGAADTRYLGVGLIELAVAPLAATVAAQVAHIAARLGPAVSGEDAALACWAAEEMLPWFLLRGRRDWLTDRLAERNEAGWCTIFTIRGGRAPLAWRKPPEAECLGAIPGRAAAFGAFLAEVAADLPASVSTHVCVCLADSLRAHYPVPILAFEKQADAASVLVPDVEFFQNQGFEAPAHADPFDWPEKLPRAVFAGATTGGPITEAVARAAALPRLRAAAHFVGSALVDFRLTAIVQCTEPAAEAVLRAAPFCRFPPLDWQAQYRHRFVISMDGNGAPWSRHYLGLRGRSALLAYRSPNLLYYHRGLTPGRHFVSIHQDQDVERVVAMEQANPGMFRGVGEAGAAFAATYLTHAMRRRYMAMLLVLHAACFA